MSNSLNITSRRWSTIAGTAEYLGVSPRSLRTYISHGIVTAYRFGPRIVRLDLNEVDAAFREVPTTTCDR